MLDLRKQAILKRASLRFRIAVGCVVLASGSLILSVLGFKFGPGVGLPGLGLGLLAVGIVLWNHKLAITERQSIEGEVGYGKGERD